MGKVSKLKALCAVRQDIVRIIFGITKESMFRSAFGVIFLTFGPRWAALEGRKVTGGELECELCEIPVNNPVTSGLHLLGQCLGHRQRGDFGGVQRRGRRLKLAEGTSQQHC